jgi:hypothetical protein
MRLGQHLGKEIQEDEVSNVIRSAISDDMVFRATLERTRLRLLNLTEDVVHTKPAAWNLASLQNHSQQIDADLSNIQSAEEISEEELSQISAIRTSGTIDEILLTFPSKPMIGAIATLLGAKPATLFALIAKALEADPNDDGLGALGHSIESLMTRFNLPTRSVQERPLTASPT